MKGSLLILLTILCVEPTFAQQEKSPAKKVNSSYVSILSCEMSDNFVGGTGPADSFEDMDLVEYAYSLEGKLIVRKVVASDITQSKCLKAIGRTDSETD